MRLKFKLEPEPELGQSDESGSSQISQLQATPGLKPLAKGRFL